MKLITSKLEKRFEEIGTQSEESNPIIIAKFFNPMGSGTWYASEYEPKTNICFGYVTGLGTNKWGYFSVTELEAITFPFSMSIERDVLFEEARFNDINEIHQ